MSQPSLIMSFAEAQVRQSFAALVSKAGGGAAFPPAPPPTPAAPQAPTAASSPAQEDQYADFFREVALFVNQAPASTASVSSCEPAVVPSSSTLSRATSLVTYPEEELHGEDDLLVVDESATEGCSEKGWSSIGAAAGASAGRWGEFAAAAGGSSWQGGLAGEVAQPWYPLEPQYHASQGGFAQQRAPQTRQYGSHSWYSVFGASSAGHQPTVSAGSSAAGSAAGGAACVAAGPHGVSGSSTGHRQEPAWHSKLHTKPRRPMKIRQQDETGVQAVTEGVDVSGRGGLGGPAGSLGVGARTGGSHRGSIAQERNPGKFHYHDVYSERKAEQSLLVGKEAAR